MNENDKKLEKLTKLAELLRDDTITPSQAKQLVELLINLNKQQKDELVKTFDGFTAEAYVKIQEAVSMVSQKHADALLEVRQLTNKQKKAHEDMMAKCMDLLTEIKSIDVQDGIDGKDADEEKIVEDVLARIPKPEQVVLDDREKIVTKINSGGKEKIDASQIKNLPQSVQTIVQGSAGFIETPLKAGANITITKDASGANVITGSAGSTIGPGTLNEIAYFDSTSTVASLATATYPSLTELSYVKGVTSAIQTQINSKIDGTMVLNRIPYGSDANTLQTSSNLMYDGTTLSISGTVFTQNFGDLLVTNSSTLGATIVMNATGTLGKTYHMISTSTAASSGPGAWALFDGTNYAYWFNATEFETNVVVGRNVTGTGLKLVSQATGGRNWLLFSTANNADVSGGKLAIFDSTAGAYRMVMDANGEALWYTGIAPDTNDGAYLGTSTKGWSDLFLASGAVIDFNAGASTITHSLNTLTIGGSGATTLALGTNSLTMTGSLAATGARVTKGWFTDLESTNMPTVGGTAILTSLTAPQFTTIELGHATDTTLARVSAGVVAIEGKSILTTDGGTLTGSITLGENTGIALDPAGSADGKWSGITITGVSDYTQAFGDLVYLKASNSRWAATDADASTTGGPVMLGMVVSAGTSGNACTLLLQGQIRADAKFPTLTIGAPVYVGETAGEIQVAIPTGADNVIRVVGFALTADEIYFNPSQDHQISVA